MALPARTNPSGGFVADASSVINLLASGFAPAIIQALTPPFCVTAAVRDELARGQPRWDARDKLDELVRAGLVAIVDLEDEALAHFESLVVGSAVDTLDDGEAATIAFAATRHMAALIDEKKARRICRERHPSVQLRTTVDAILSEAVRQALKAAGVGDALFSALTVARMQVDPADINRVLAVLGEERALLCRSLPRRHRIEGR